MFDLEKQINSWVSQLRKDPRFEDGDIAELEEHLRDGIENKIDAGLSPKDAYSEIIESFGPLTSTGSELAKARTINLKPPKPDFLAHNYSTSTNPILSKSIMLNNYIKIALRNIRKQKLFSFINIFSLTIGLSATLLIFLFIQDEIKFDDFNLNKRDIHRVLQVQHEVDGSLAYKGTSHAISMGPELVREIPGIINYTRFFEHWSSEGSYVKANNKTLREAIIYGDFQVFSMFSFPMISGSAEGRSPFEVVLSEKISRKYFNETEAVGQTFSIRIDDSFIDFKVVGVIKDIPSNSSIKFDVLVNFTYLTEVGFMKNEVTNWGFGAINTFIQKEPQAEVSSMQIGLDKLLATHYPYYAEIANQRGYKSALDYRQLNLQPLLDVHFDSSVTSGLQPASNKIYSVLLGLIAMGILLIGCINFMNLSIGRSSNRAKEIGLRKTIGANRKQLIFQFLSESIILAITALLIAFLTVKLLLPFFNMITGKELYLSILFQPSYITLIVGITLLTGFISGVYPAFALSNFKLEDVFSGKLKIGGSNTFTKILVVFQFSLAALLIIGMLGISSQMRFIQNKDLGFNGDQVVVIPNNSSNNTSVFTHFKQTLNDVPEILSIAAADQTFGNNQGLGGMGFEFNGKPMRTGIIRVSESYLETMQIELNSGRRFNPDLSSDFTKAIIVNETLLEDFELSLNGTFEPINRTKDQSKDPVVIGVMKNFYYNSLSVEVEPMLIRLSKSDDLGYILIKISTENMTSTLDRLSSAWKVVAPDLPFEYTFLDDTMAAQYATQENWSRIISIAMIIAIILSCFGLFGLVSMAIAGKKNEIGVRRVLGATIGQIVKLYSWKYTKLVLISFVIAVPVSYYVLKEWLQTFAYRISITYEIYLLAVLIIVGIAFITVIFKILEAALANPAQVLRDE